jgi:ATP-dependent exoDNAse (exonuclease V) alpha subunit
VLGSNTLDHHLSYVAMTRHRDEMRLYGEPVALRRLERNHENGAVQSLFIWIIGINDLVQDARFTKCFQV